jgi:hypothetical protein
MYRGPIVFVACLFALLPGIAMHDARASETDQFTLPSPPLDDLGRDLGARVLEIIGAETAKLNLRIDEKMQGNARTATEPVDEREFVTDVYEQVGVGVPESTLERAIRYGSFPGRRVLFQTGYSESIYAWVFAPVPFALMPAASSPTVRLYGLDLGTDKIGHLFQQGYEYLSRYEDALAKGVDEASARAAAVKYGVLTELGLYGVMLTGVYSNGDLAANYAGLKFYRNLFHEIRIGDQTIAPILVRDGVHWIINPDRDNPDVLKPYITEHLNEAFNPSKYMFNVDRIREHVRERCASWLKHVPDFDEAGYRAHLRRTSTWFGEPYGWDLPEANAANLLLCFAPSGSVPDRDPAAM